MMKPLQHKLAKIGLWGFTLLAFGLLLAPTVRGQESSPEALNVYADAAGFQNGGQYDLAADEWEKFLKRFAKDPLFKKAQYYAGVCRLQLQEHAKAAAHFEQVTKDPKFELIEDAYLNLAWCQFSLGRLGKPEMFPQAVTNFAALAKKFPKGKYKDQALFYLGESQYAQAKKEEAVAAYKQLVDEHKKSTLRCDALYAMGVTLEELADFPQAGTAYDLFLKECTTSPLVTEVRMRKAETILQAGDLARAAKMFAEVAAVEGFAAADHAIMRQAFCAAKQEKFAEAGSLYAKLATDYPDSASVAAAAISAGRNFYLAEKPEDATKWLQVSIEAKGPDAPEAGHWLCRIHMKRGEYTQAAELAKSLLPAAAESEFLVDLKIDEADSLYEAAETRPAALARYLKIAADHAEHRLAPLALYNAAFTALDLKKYDQGLEHADAMVAKFPEDVLVPDAKSVAAECCVHLEKYADSEQRFAELVADYADHAEHDAWQVRHGFLLYLQKKYGECTANLVPVLAELSAPDHLAEANFYVGASHFFQDAYEESEKFLAASLKANPKWRKSDEVLLLLSRSQWARDDFDLARQTIKQMLTNFPESSFAAEAHYRLGQYNYDAGDHAAASEAYAKVIAEAADSPFAPYARYGKGWAHLASRQFEEGVTEFAALLTNHAQHQLVADTHFARAMCLRQLSQYEAAIKDIEVYLKSDLKPADKSIALYERGQCEAGLKDYATAVATFEALLKADPKYPQASGVLYEIGWSLKNIDKEDEATVAFARIAKEFGESSHAAEANFHVGESLYANKDYEAAVASYAAAKKLSKLPELSEKAIHKLGWAYYRLNQFDKALAEFDEQLKAHAEGKLAPDAAFMRAESLFEAEDFEKALPAFTAARQTLPESEAMQILLLLHGGQSAAQLENWELAGEFLEPLPQKYPETPLLAEVLFERGRARQNLNRLDQALEDFERASTISRTAIGARSRFMIGEIEFQKKEYEAAVSTFRKVMYGYGGDKALDEIKPWQAVSGFEAGRCAETQIASANAQTRPGLIADAKKFYTFVVEKHPTSQYAAKAKQRLADLAKL